MVFARATDWPDGSVDEDPDTTKLGSLREIALVDALRDPRDVKEECLRHPDVEELDDVVEDVAQQRRCSLDHCCHVDPSVRKRQTAQAHYQCFDNSSAHSFACVDDV